MSEEGRSPRERAAEFGVHALSPHLVCRDAADAIDFYRNAFGAEELMRLPGPDGKVMHACIRINGSSVMLVDENCDHGLLSPETLKGSPVKMHLVVDDADSFFARAVDAGARIIMPVSEMFWGDRYGQLEDPFGHQWAIATPGRPMSEQALKDAAIQAFRAPDGC